MPRFFFDFADAGATYPDTEGTELPNVEAAKAEAATALAEIVRDRSRDGIYRELVVTVRSEIGEILLQVVARFEIATVPANTAPAPGRT
ncbi:hypothetical protein [Mesorhizobium sp.]|uniref:DUF6894 family protein n=2 Tax=Mesorhizobium sp. TaxID=1871066 RepID=UPI000FE4DC56|nr:hypothetical protein [Mesorhizobium sp.]RWI10916.1 MAG: hypothetical protein EOQ92_33105 [Mesorhizobium sp.]RWK87944.1 MAG: hypothetical protein EOR53_34575 [Mesorhizobium sp.]RWL01042.1 MAG: hypothetical protein EOR45_18150 [Mesorhizobium sp.]TIP56421.1 MAG: hypothetical protein E5X56_24625 [Mesorhizobium sp.]TIP80061.1 MAG: hypothetical protein E5X63_32640 [Mesorhizobium sp.]